MSSLLSFARAGPSHPGQNDEEANIASSSNQQQRGSRWSRPFGGRSSSGNQHALAVEMTSQTPNTAANINADIEQGAVHHEPGILSALSVPSLSNLRRRDREQERRRQNARVQAEQPAGSTPTAPMTSILGGGSLLAAVMLPQNTTTNPTASTAASRSAVRKARTSRREREEAATLFGPNLANYFGSGISSSGAVSSHGAGVPQPPPITSPLSPTAAKASSPQPNDPSTAVDPASTANNADAAYPQGSVPSRRVRLGSRGRARGASLSGLSMMSLGAESVTSLGGINTERTNDTIAPAQGMMQGSTADLIDQLNRQGLNDDSVTAMSEGVDINTLQRWIQKSIGLAHDASNPGVGAGADAMTPAPAGAYGPPVFTTLQSFVNLKRNTLKLTATSNAASTTAMSSAKTSDANVNLLRSKSSLSVLPTLSYGTAAFTPAGNNLLPEPTHSLYFEYDCAAPYAVVQIYVRASRKHGSWLNWQPPTHDASDPLSAKTNEDGSPAWLAQTGPPPHVLGWPVHVAKLKKGFAVGHTANIPLHLQYYAPPKAKKTDRNASAGEGSEAEKRGQGSKRAMEPPAPAAIPETPGFELNRRFDFDGDDADEDNNNGRASGRGAAAANANANATAGAQAENGATQGAIAKHIVEEETKEQRLAREKAERETLKVAIVVEALDENARPLREPNLQTSYIRLNSLPLKKSVAERHTDLTRPTSPTDAEKHVPRNWTSQLEGQEAEIGPHRFQLQELYGLSSKPPAVAPAPVAEDGEEDGTAGAGGMAPMDMEASNGRAYTSMLHLSKADEKSIAQQGHSSQHQQQIM
ncbi:uncharacterized protein UBRO2_00886 [Ustilago bromivora]|uniref:Uncharacterized protein n=1 Tax=Ustilago bromivora TaxID=307758 RepID=A0A8H8TPK1_9BASI|nr:uncharacterized protein UBRO2_00886 [Ustilago bromivora]